MNLKRLAKSAADPRFISGIYNYCDRWCERCPFTQRCLNFAMQEEAGFQSSEEHDLKSGEFWQKLGGIFEQTIEMLEEAAREAGIDLSSPDAQAEALAEERQLRRREAKNQALPGAAMRYSKAVDHWMKAAAPAFHGKGLELETEARLEIGNPHGETARLKDLVEVIRWYQPFIYVKLSRAIGSQVEEQMERDPELRAFPKDSEGTAKVALVAMDRSIAAWAGLREALPEEEDRILDLMRQLAAIRRDTELKFPQARSFVRPGLDW
jgi:hypothetical protein